MGDAMIPEVEDEGKLEEEEVDFGSSSQVQILVKKVNAREKKEELHTNEYSGRRSND